MVIGLIKEKNYSLLDFIMFIIIFLIVFNLIFWTIKLINKHNLVDKCKKILLNNECYQDGGWVCE